jgi:predicted Fe-S protein YdhL (DUF1289 family)
LIPLPQMETPCVKICAIDNASGMCTGCGRTRREIASWSSITSAERRRIMSELQLRMKQER